MKTKHLFQLLSTTREMARIPLYFKKIGGPNPQHIIIQNDKSLKIGFRDVISYDTYFNTFFEQYVTSTTNIDRIALSLKLKGKGIIEIFRHITGKASKTLLHHHFDTLGEIKELQQEIILEREHVMGSRISFNITGMSGGCSWYEGAWYVFEPPARNISLNIVICTFKKPAYVDRAVQNLLALPVLNECDWRLLIIDNASELEKNRYDSERIKIYHQKNSGGAGGFTRGIMESLSTKDKSNREATHLLLMDDDIELDPERVFHSINYLKYTRQDSCLGGGMIDMDKAVIMHEHGSHIGKNNSFIDVFSQFHNLNLTEAKTLYTLSQSQQKVSYNAWWFFAFPISACKKIGLPMPCFIRGDDQEFGLRLTRSGSSLLTPPGIALWHEPFEAKHAGWTFYFGIYNNLIITATHKQDTDIKAVAQEIRERFILPFLRKKNYAWALAVMGAIEDFLKGPDFFMYTEPPERMKRAKSFDEQYGYQKVVSANNIPQAQKIKTFIARELWRRCDYGNSCKSLFKFLGLIQHKALINETEWTWQHAAQVDTLYVQSTHVPFIKIYETNTLLYKSAKKNMSSLLNELENNYTHIRQKFVEASQTYTQYSFWEKYLNIK